MSLITPIFDPVGGAKQYITPDPITNAERVGIVLSGFGLPVFKGLLYKPAISQAQQATQIQLPIKSAEYNEVTTNALKSYLGTSVLANLVFKPGSYIDQNNQTINYSGLRVDTVLVDVAVNKNIVKTSIQGKNYTVKEYISSSDIAISIKGALLSIDGQKYPKSDMEALIKLVSVPQALEIECWPVNQHGVFNIVIENVNYPQSEGKYNEQLFTIQALSDPPLDLF